MLFTPARRHSGFDLFDDFFNDPFFSTSISQPTNSLMRTDVREDGANYLAAVFPLAKGYGLAESVERAKTYLSGALGAMLDLGRGPGPMDHAFDVKPEYREEAT